LNTKIKNSF